MYFCDSNMKTYVLFKMAYMSDIQPCFAKGEMYIHANTK